MVEAAEAAKAQCSPLSLHIYTGIYACRHIAATVGWATTIVAAAATGTRRKKNRDLKKKAFMLFLAS